MNNENWAHIRWGSKHELQNVEERRNCFFSQKNERSKGSKNEGKHEHGKLRGMR